MSSGKYSDNGYRFRKNSISLVDHWIPFYPPSKESFYDVKHYNTDTLNVDPRSEVIAELYFRLDADMIEHSRKVYSFMDWLGDMGGIPAILSDGVMAIIGGYLAFN